MKATNNIAVKENSPIDLLTEASGLFSELIGREMEKIGIRGSYRHVMGPLVENASLTQLQLVRITKLKAPTISITLRNMESEGLVRREKNDTDRRETHVAITEKGRGMYQKLLAAVDRTRERMLAGLSDAELNALCATIDKMTDNLRAELK